MEEDIKYWLGVLKADNFNKSFIDLVEYLIARNKELEEKNFYLPAWVGKNYIPKSKVREKIEYYKKEWNRQEKEGLKNLCMMTSGGISALEELLQEGDK